MVFTALGLSASALGGVFGGVVVGDGGGGGGSSASALSALASLVGVLMGLQLLELIRVPLPSLDFGLRRIALAFDGGGTGRRRGRGGVGGGGGSLFEENGGLVLGTMTTMTTAEEEDDGEGYDATRALLVRTFLLGGTSALVASPCWASFASPHRHRRHHRRSSSSRHKRDAPCMRRALEDDRLAGGVEEPLVHRRPAGWAGKWRIGGGGARLSRAGSW
ncbi:hypothetical protein ACHAW5_008191 [Stephanodiscus triporus]|uniref:Solute carrier family 40 protein n=1 Tax=Stephanodiscus triporus TaxID=2934178 RepID=A0ABD3N0J1_9STRA